MPKHYMYILRCSDDTYYIGSTRNLERRFNQHLDGTASQYTAERLPIEIVHYEIFSRIDWAFEREHQIKRWTRAKKEALIYGDIELLKEKSKKAFKSKK